MNNWKHFGSILVAAGLGMVFTAQSQTNLAVGVAADSEVTMRQKLWDAYNQTRQDLYGKVIDQDGHPVAGVEVTGTIEFIQADKPDLHYKTQTDTNGLFQFTGLHGAGLAVKVAKAGYEMDNQSGGAVFDPSGQSSPTNRVIFMMWKLRGPEPMKHVLINSSVPCDGTPEHFDLLSSKMNHTMPDVQRSSGDFLVKLTRDPLIVDRRRPFNWSVELAITNGGFFGITDQIYPYEAPAGGYKSKIEFSFQTNTVGWTNEVMRNYYFKAHDGKVYGRMKLDILADRPQPPTYFDADIYVNPAGSRNLEFDGAKQIY